MAKKTAMGVPDRSGDPRRGKFITSSGNPVNYTLAVNRPGTGDRAWQVDAWHDNGGYLGGVTKWHSTREDALAESHAEMEKHGRLPHDVAPEFRKKARKSRGYL